MARTILIIGTLLLVAVGCSSRTEPPPAPAPASTELAEGDDLMAKVREYTERFYRGELDLLYEEFSPGLQEEFSLEQFSTVYEYVGENFGKETQIIGEDEADSDEYRGFVRWARFDKTDKIIEIRWTLRRDDDSIAEFWIRPAEKKIGSAGSP